MRTVIIGGVCRTGKSHLANQIFQNTKSTVINADSLTNFLKKHIPEKFSVSFELDGVLRLDPSEVILKTLIRNMGKEFNYLKIIDSSAISPETIDRLFRGDRYISMFLGHPRVDVFQKLQEIRQAAQNNIHCWSHQYSNREMLQYIKHFKSLSIQLEQKCKHYNIDRKPFPQFSRTCQSIPSFLRVVILRQLSKPFSISF